MSAHNHEHGHHHGHHHHKVDMDSLNRVFVIGIVLNLAFVVAEVVAGLYSHSLALLTDAGHNLADVAGLALSLIAFGLAKRKADKNFTYGYSKTTILVALVNAVVLLLGVCGIGYEAVKRLFNPEPMMGTTMAIVAGVGIVINTVSALLFLRDKDKELNARGAYLHLAADAVVSAGVVIAGVVIVYTGWYWLDSVVSLVIMVVILYSTWELLTDSLRLTLDAVPRDINIETLRSQMMKTQGICDVHHIHVWAISTQVNALTAHVVVNESVSPAEEQKIKDNLKHELQHLNIQHATLETERSNTPCKQEDC